jgi:NAD(P)H-flavin reductase
MYARERREEFGDIEILYGARTPADLVYSDQFDDIQRIRDTKLLLTVDAVPEGQKWKHKVGVVTTLFEDMKLTEDNTIALTCGPEVMLRFVVRGLLERGFSEDQIYLSLERRMKCGIGKCGHCQIGSKFVCLDGPVFRYGEVKDLPDMII